jgi:hypothetical protein
MFGFPVVVSGFGDTVFSVNLFDVSAAFDLLKNTDDLFLFES